ncbi:hypothetical protein ANPL_02985 [Anaplasma platys]|uniref:Uncharacterized protein n=1 Tax=Anaplasma platys TaxID=949 RepID=A0A858PYK8_9RICK|nr:hypothetical protein [Anaplasma platys]QJC27654.1 hypothetical protein ANPL_02985 [Anaplasma platys]
MKRSQNSAHFTNTEAEPGVDKADGIEIKRIEGVTRTYVRDSETYSSSSSSVSSAESAHLPQPDKRKFAISIMQNIKEIARGMEKSVTTYHLWTRKKTSVPNRDTVEGQALEKQRIERISTAQVELGNVWEILNEKYVKNVKSPQNALAQARVHCYVALSQLRELFLLRNVTLEGRIATLKAIHSVSDAACDIYNLEENKTEYAAAADILNSQYSSRVHRAQDLLLYSLKCSHKIKRSDYGALLKSAASSFFPLATLLSKNIPDAEKNNIYLLAPFGLQYVISAIDNGTVTGFSTPGETFDIVKTTGQPYSIVASLAARFFIHTLKAFDNLDSIGRKKHNLRIPDLAITQMYLSECIMLTKRKLKSCKTGQLRPLKCPLQEIKKHLSDALSSCMHGTDDITRCYITLKLKQVGRILVTECDYGFSPEHDTDNFLEKIAISIQRCLDRLDLTRELYDHNWTRSNIALALFPGEQPPARNVVSSYEATSFEALQNAFKAEKSTNLSSPQKKSLSPSLLKRFLSRSTKKGSATEVEKKRRLSEESDTSVSAIRKRTAGRFGPLPPLPNEIQPEIETAQRAPRRSKPPTIRELLLRNSLISATSTSHAPDIRAQSGNELSNATPKNSVSSSGIYMDMRCPQNSELGVSTHKTILSSTTGTIRRYLPHVPTATNTRRLSTLSNTVYLERTQSFPAHACEGHVYTNCVHESRKDSAGELASGKVMPTEASTSIENGPIPQRDNSPASAYRFTEKGAANEAVFSRKYRGSSAFTGDIDASKTVRTPGSNAPMRDLAMRHTHAASLNENTALPSAIPGVSPLHTVEATKSVDTSHNISPETTAHGSCSPNPPECIELLQQAADISVIRRRQRSRSETLTNSSSKAVDIRNETMRGRSKSLEIAESGSDLLGNPSPTINSSRNTLSTAPVNKLANIATVRRGRRSRSETLTNSSSKAADIRNETMRGRSKSLEIAESGSDLLGNPSPTINSSRNTLSTAPVNKLTNIATVRRGRRSVSETVNNTSPRVAIVKNDVFGRSDSLEIIRDSCDKDYETFSAVAAPHLALNKRATDSLQKETAPQQRKPQTTHAGQKQVPVSRPLGKYSPMGLPHSYIYASSQTRNTTNVLQSFTQSEQRPQTTISYSTVSTMHARTLTDATKIPVEYCNIANAYESVRCPAAKAFGASRSQYINVASPYAVTTVTGEYQCMKDNPRYNRYDLRLRNEMLGSSMNSLNSEDYYGDVGSIGRITEQLPQTWAFEGLYVREDYAQNAPYFFADEGAPVAQLNYAEIYPMQGSIDSAEYVSQNSYTEASHVSGDARYVSPYYNVSHNNTSTNQQNTAGITTSQTPPSFPQVYLPRPCYNTRLMSSGIMGSYYTPRGGHSLHTLREDTEETISAFKRYGSASRTHYDVPRAHPTSRFSTSNADCRASTIEAHRDAQIYHTGISYTAPQNVRARTPATSRGEESYVPCKHRMPATIDERQYDQRARMHRALEACSRRHSVENPEMSARAIQPADHLYESIGNELDCLSITPAYPRDGRESPQKL